MTATAMRTSAQRRRCAHPRCGDVIDPGETYEVFEREAWHVECALVRAEESKRPPDEPLPAAEDVKRLRATVILRTTDDRTLVIETPSIRFTRPGHGLTVERDDDDWTLTIKGTPTGSTRMIAAVPPPREDGDTGD